MNKLFSLFLLLFLSIPSHAASTMEEFFYASGKYRVVITVAAVVMAGIFVYLITLDRRVKKLENKDK